MRKSLDHWFQTCYIELESNLSRRRTENIAGKKKKKKLKLGKTDPS